MKTIKLTPTINELYKIHEIIFNEIKTDDFQLELIIEEIFINIVNYSNTDYIYINYEYDEENSIISLEFIDNGTEFNPLETENPKMVEKVEEAEIGGLGIYLIKNMVDDIRYSYNNNENHLKLIKSVK